MILTQRLWLRETCHSQNSRNYTIETTISEDRKYQTSNVCQVKMDPGTSPLFSKMALAVPKTVKVTGLATFLGRRFDGRLFGSLLWNSCFKRDGHSNAHNLTHPCVLRATPRVNRREYAMLSVTWQTWRISQSICPPRNGFESIQTFANLKLTHSPKESQGVRRSESWFLPVNLPFKTQRPL